jgi:subtilisin family serine protease
MVTALDSLDRKADFADWNDDVVVSAPGTGVRSAYPGGDWGLGSGCSFATPFISAESALILSLWPGLPPAEVRNRVEQAVVPIYEIPENEPYDEGLGTGRLYLPLAVGSGSAGAPGAGFTAAAPVVYPNPSPGSLRLRLPSPGEAAARAELRVYDATGKLVHEQSAPDRVLTWNGLDLRGRPVASGVYYMLARSDGESHRLAVRILR